MRTKFALAATTAGLIVAMGGYASAEGTKSSSSSDAPAASSGSTVTKSTTSSSATAARASGATLQETKSDDLMAKPLNIRAKDLRDMDIYGADGKKIAEVDHVLTDSSNEIKAVSADVGGFLGMGSREVVIPIERLSKGSDKDRLQTAMTKDQIDKLDRWADTAGSGSTSGSSTTGSSVAPGAATSTAPGVPASPAVPRTAPPASGVAPNSR